MSSFPVVGVPFRFCRFLRGSCDEGLQFFDIFRKHAREVDAVSYLGVARHHGADNQEGGGSDLEFEFDFGADGKRHHGFDVAAVKAEIGSRVAKGRIVTFDMQFDWGFDFNARMMAPLWWRRHWAPPNDYAVMQKYNRDARYAGYDFFFGFNDSQSASLRMRPSLLNWPAPCKNSPPSMRMISPLI